VAQRAFQLRALGLGHPARGEAGAECLQFRHDLEHLNQVAERQPGDDCSLARPRLDQPG
jgi:hypothetical protein